MNKPYHYLWSIQQKLIFPLLAMGLVVFGSGLMVIRATMIDRLEKEALNRAETIANAVRYAVQTAQNSHELERFVTAMGTEKEVIKILLVTGDPAQVLASTQLAQIGLPLEQLAPSEMVMLERASKQRRDIRLINKKNHEIVFTSPLLLSNFKLSQTSLGNGSVLVLLDGAPLYAGQATSVRILGGILAAVLLAFGLVVFLLLRHLVLAPTRAITSSIARRAAGDTKSVVPALANDELGTVANTLTSLFESLDIQHRRYASLVTHIPGIIYRKECLDGSWRLTFLNPEVTEITGYPMEKFHGPDGIDLIDLIHGPDRERAVLTMKQAFEQKKSWELEYRIKIADGSIRWIFEKGQGLFDEKGEVLCREGFLLNITARKRAEKTIVKRATELEEVRRFLDSIIETMPVILFVKDAVELRYVQINRACEELFGVRREEMLGKVDADIFPPEQAVDYLEQDREVLAGDGSVFIREEEIVVSDGRKFTLLTRKMTLFDRKGKPKFLLGLSEDISNQKAVENVLIKSKEEAEAGMRAKSDFLATMSHEIRTPMNGILGMTHLLMDTSLDGEQQQFAETLHSSAESLLTIINDILDFSKIEAGRFNIVPVHFDLQVAVSEVTELLGAKAREAGLELLVEFEDEVPRFLVGDAGRIRQILMNLVSNAIKFTREGYVSIHLACPRVGEQEAEIKVSVEDTGIGIPSEAQNKLFQSFIQADASTTRQFGGTGLGLAISKQLTELMGGRIGMNSQLGEGSTFWFTLRLPLSLEHSPGRLEEVDLRSVRILIVDDNETHLAVSTASCRWMGMDVTGVSSGAEALETLHRARSEAKPFQLGLLDYQMPGMDGEQLGRQIKNDPLLRHTALTMMTVLGRRGDARHFYSAGFSAYVVKPIQRGLLRDILAAVWRAHSQNKPPSKLITRHTIAETRAIYERENQPPNGLGCRILLAEDNLINQKVATKMLAKLGCEVDLAENGKRALEKLETGSYDLVLMDCQMPELDGYEATLEIREKAASWSAIPIIAMTANAIEGDRERCLEVGMDDYIRKPVSPKMLGDVLRKHAPPSSVAGKNGDR